jgi:anthranilate phosphoribosyltransferase
MSILPPLSIELGRGQHLSREQARSAALELARAEVPFEDKKAFLSALTKKGETATEVAAFAHAFRNLSRGTGLDDFAPKAIDIVGTGGSGFGGYNISSAAAIVVAAAGVPVLKHGNRAITSQSGAADFLSALGVPQTPSLDGLRRSVEELNFCFLFAPNFHPAFKEIGPVRKALAAEGSRSIFNILGPLINPAKPAYELLGAFSPAWVEPLAGALGELGLSSGLCAYGFVPGRGGVDELTSAGENRVAGFGLLKDFPHSRTPEDFGLARCPAGDLAGGSAQENVALLHRLARGEGPKGLLDTISLNAGAAFHIVGMSPSVQAGTILARSVLTGGGLAVWLERAARILPKVQ